MTRKASKLFVMFFISFRECLVAVCPSFYPVAFVVFCIGLVSSDCRVWTAFRFYKWPRVDNVIHDLLLTAFTDSCPGYVVCRFGR